MSIFLIGFMGCGKTTLGKKLAAKLSYQFIDMDQIIETEVGMTIPEYFRQFGELDFREKEKQVLQHTPFPGHSVIATGGGAPCFFDNMDWMNRNGVTVYIRLSPKGLASRLAGESDNRPVLKGLKGEALESFIASKLEEREVFYQQAQVIVDGIDLGPEKLISVLVPAYLK